jgi:SAM-dependent methyltransferase
MSRAREFWEGTEGRWQNPNWTHWLQHPKVQERLNVLTTGDPQVDRYKRFLDRYFSRRSGGYKRVNRVLTLGCGHGDFERGMAKYNFSRVHEAIDISSNAVAEAARLAAAEGFTHIHYRQADLNTIELAPCRYDVIFGISSVHHVSELRRLFRQIAVALKPGGLFLLDEFIGPDKFQWTDVQLAAINEQIAALPPRLKTSVHDGTQKGAIWRLTIEQMDAIDPSEAVRSSEITSLLPEYFDVLEFNGYGGSLLHMLLEGITGNFAENDREAMAHLQALFDTEDRLIASGALQHDFANIVVRRKPTRIEKLFGRHAAYAVSKLRSRSANPA